MRGGLCEIGKSRFSVGQDAYVTFENIVELSQIVTAARATQAALGLEHLLVRRKAPQNSPCCISVARHPRHLTHLGGWIAHCEHDKLH